MIIKNDIQNLIVSLFRKYTILFLIKAKLNSVEEAGEKTPDKPREKVCAATDQKTGAAHDRN
jgi:hypothetical protein